MITEPITLDHQVELEALFKELHPELHEYSFASIYLNRKLHEYVLVRTENRLFIQGKTYDQKRFLLPLFDLRLCAPEELQKYLATVDFFYPINEVLAPQIPLKAYFFEQDSDYLHSIEKMKTYPGRHLQGQRNHVHQFESHYQSEACAITNEHKTALHAILEGWGQRDDYEDCKEAIMLLERLHLFGRIYFVEKKPVGFLIGERLNHNTCVLHYAKADAEIKGIYPYMYQDFARQLEGGIEWLNLEQDLGDQGLKQAKASYHPEKLLRKLRLTND